MKLVYGFAVLVSIGLITVFWIIPLDIVSVFTEPLVKNHTVLEPTPQVKVMPDPERPPTKKEDLQVKKDPLKASKTEEEAVPLQIKPLESPSTPVKPSRTIETGSHPSKGVMETMSYNSVKSEIKDWLETLGKISPLLTIGIAVWSKKKDKKKSLGKKKVSKKKDSTKKGKEQ